MEGSDCESKEKAVSIRKHSGTFSQWGRPEPLLVKECLLAEYTLWLSFARFSGCLAPL